MQARLSILRRFSLSRCSVPVILALGSAGAFGQQVEINFGPQCPNGIQNSGPCSTTFIAAGGAQTLSIPTSLGNVIFQGGVLLDDATNGPADENAAYGTADFGGSGLLESITITFPSPVTNFFISVLNGLTTVGTYSVSDNAGHSSSFSVPPAANSGIQGVGFTTAGTVITISTTGANWDFAIAQVSFSPLPPNPVLKWAPNIVSFSALAQSAQPLQQSIIVENQGSGSLAFNASVVSNSPWVTISPASGSATLSTPVPITVTVNPAALTVGSYRDVIHISTPVGNADIPVTFFGANVGPIVAVSPLGATFSEVQGAGSSASQIITILNNGSAGTNVDWIAGTATGAGVPNGDFLVFDNNSGLAQPGNPGSLTLSLNSNAANLKAGVYYQLVMITDQNAQNSPQYVTVVLNVLPPATPVLPQLLPAGLLFTGLVGQKIPPQQFAVNWSSTQTQIFQTVPLATPPTWLQVSPTGGSASTAFPALATVQVSTTGLAAGVYQGTVAVVGTTGTVAGAVNVTLILGVNTGFTGPAVHPDDVRPEAGITGCAPSALVLTETGLPNNFSVPAGWPANLVATMTDDCGNPIESGAVTASFTNGDAPLSLAGQGSGGQYAATWQPSTASVQTVLLNGTAGSLTPALAQLSGVVNANPAPVLNPGGILNNFSYAVGGALAPGTVSAAFGSGLSTSQTGITTTTTPLPTAVQNTQLVVAGFLAPLYYVGPSQLNVEIPAEIRPLQQYPAVGVVNGALTLPVSIPLVPTAPGVLFDLTDQSANCTGAVHICALIAQHNDFSLVDAASPAHPGEDLVMYVVGMGTTNPAISSGQVAPGLVPGSTLASAVVQPVVQVNNQTAPIIFAGLTPGFVGLYQINFTVPTTATAGTLNVTVTQGASTANTTTLPVVVP